MKYFGATGNVFLLELKVIIKIFFKIDLIYSFGAISKTSKFAESVAKKAPYQCTPAWM